MQPYYYVQAKSANRSISRWPVLWVIGGVMLGIVLTLGVLLLFPPKAIPLDPPSGTGDVSISIDDNFVKHQAVRGVSEVHLPFGISDLKTHINAGNSISVSGVISGGPFAGQFAATSQVGIANGALLSHLTSAQVGSITLPGWVTTLLDQAIDVQLDSSVAKLLPTSTGLVLSSITTTSGQLTLVITQQ
jgi:hypothetical protein